MPHRRFVDVLEERQLLTAYTWIPTTAGNFNWNTNATWDQPAGFPNATTDTANLNINIAGNQTINLNQAITVNNLTAGDSTSAFFTETFAPNGGSLTFDGASPSLNVPVGVGGGVTISAPITLNAD
jgi:hypothetical protein